MTLRPSRQFPHFPKPTVVTLLILVSIPWLCALSCYPAPSNRSKAARKAASDTEWSWLNKAKQELDAKRARLDATPSDPSKELGSLRAAAAREGGELNRRLVAFINAEPPVEGQPLTPRQRAAIRMKSDEDILLGRVFIEQGGDFQRAIEIYEGALGLDPTYEPLRNALEEARARRYVSREAFDGVKERMSDEEVRKLLGQPNLHNIREYDEHGVVGWFYPKDETGAAAGVWFAREGGALRVYKLDFDAIQPHSAAPGGPPTV